jgi:hypothetical protein
VTEIAQPQHRIGSVPYRLALWREKQRALGRQTGRSTKSATPQQKRPPYTLFDAAVRWLLPWDDGRRDYPGIGKGSAELLGRRYETVRSWRRGRTRAPADVLERLAGLLALGARPEWR